MHLLQRDLYPHGRFQGGVGTVGGTRRFLQPRNFLDDRTSGHGAGQLFDLLPTV